MVNFLRASIIALAAALASQGWSQRFHVVTDHGVRWLEGPARERVFSLGVCVVDTGTKFDEYDVTNPAYGAWRFYPSKPAWAQDAVSLLATSGFNTVGAWSEYRSLLDVPNNQLWMTPILHSGSSAGFPWLDMWDPALVKVADDVTKGLVGTLKKDKRIIGYFSDNELGWWKPGVFGWVWKQKTPYERRQVVKVLKGLYKGSWKALTADFDAVGASSWSQLNNKGALFLHPGGNGQPAITTVLGFLADRYYSLCRSQIKKADPDALYLGDRYISNYYPEVAEAAGKYCDVVSTNLNPDFTDGGFVRFHLDTLETITNRPLMITEYYMCARENRSGNGNDRSGFPVVDTLEQRAAGFAKTTKDLLANPNVVGAHWFQYYDEPKNGRGDGENYNFGLVDTSNHPYQELLDRAKALDLNALHRAASPLPVGVGLPPAPAGPSDIGNWNRDAAFIPSESRLPVGDLYAVWKPEGLDLGMIWHEERFSEDYYRDKKIPDCDRSTVEIRIPGQPTPYLIRLKDKGGVRLSGPEWKIESTPGTSSRLIVHIPATAFAPDTLKSGGSVYLDVFLTSRCRAYITRWHIQRPLAN